MKTKETFENKNTGSVELGWVGKAFPDQNKNAYHRLLRMPIASGELSPSEVVFFLPRDFLLTVLELDFISSIFVMTLTILMASTALVKSSQCNPIKPRAVKSNLRVHWIMEPATSDATERFLLSVHHLGKIVSTVFRQLKW